MTLETQLWECNACKARYPIVPYYRVAAPHGPNKDCLGEQGWTVIEDDPRKVSRELHK